jgi:hypothetical protein
MASIAVPLGSSVVSGESMIYAPENFPASLIMLIKCITAYHRWVCQLAIALILRASFSQQPAWRANHPVRAD